MTAAAKNTFGTVLKLADTGGTPAVVAELTSIKAPSLSREVIEAMTHDSASQAMEYIPDGVYDVGEIECEGNLIAGSTEDDLFVAAVITGTVQDFEILLKASTGTYTISGSAIATNYDPQGMPVKGGKQTFSATLKPTGALTIAATV